MMIDASRVELERKRLNETMFNIVSPIIDMDMYEKFGTLPFRAALPSLLQLDSVVRPMSPSDVRNLKEFEKSLGMLKKCSFPLAAFGFTDVLLRRGSDNPISLLIDMATYLGVVQGAIMFSSASYNAAKQGGVGRSKVYKLAKDRVVEIYLKMPELFEKSAEKAAEDILGMDGVNLGFRMIADTIREQQKVQSAQHNVHRAKHK